MRKFQTSQESHDLLVRYAKGMLYEDVTLHEAKRVLVQEALTMTGGNQTQAAHKLGITRDQLRYFLNKITRPQNPCASSEETTCIPQE